MTRPGTWFATQFDEERSDLASPATVARGTDPAVIVADHVLRLGAHLGRVTGESGAVMLRLSPTTQRVRVTVRVHLDSPAVTRWSESVAGGASHELPRLVVIGSQKAVRAAVVLARRHGWLRTEAAAATLSFDLPEAELAVGLMVVELADVWHQLPAAARAWLSRSSPIGLRIDSVEVAVAPPELPSSPVLNPGAAAASQVVVEAVLRPDGTAGVRCRIHIGAGPLPPPLVRTPTHRWPGNRQALLLARLFRAKRRAASQTRALFSRLVRNRVMLEGVSLVDGSPVEVRTSPGARRRLLDVSIVARVPGPVLIGAVRPTAWGAVRTLTTVRVMGREGSHER